MNRRAPTTITTLKNGGCVIERGKLPDKLPMRTSIRLPAAHRLHVAKMHTSGAFLCGQPCGSQNKF
jgi:hypothetical protein